MHVRGVTQLDSVALNEARWLGWVGQSNMEPLADAAPMSKDSLQAAKE